MKQWRGERGEQAKDLKPRLELGSPEAQLCHVSELLSSSVFSVRLYLAQ